MSSTHLGRSVQSPVDYLSARLEAERNDLRRSNEALRNESRKLGGKVDDLQRDVRSAARGQARREARQQACESMTRRVAARQEEFERHARQREQELREEIRGTEQRLGQEIEHLAAVTAREVGAVRQEVTDLRQHMDSEVRDVRAEVTRNREQLEQRMDGVRRDLEHQVTEVREGIRKQGARRSGEAGAIVAWVEQRAAGLDQLDALGLTVEGTRIQESLRLAKERLSGGDPEMALPTAESAMNALQTAFLERERRLGVIAGSADHLEEVAADLERRAAGAEFRKVFLAEAERLKAAATELRARAESWRRRPQWTAFEVERQDTLDRAHRLAMLSLELEAVLPNVIKRLEERDLRMKDAAAVASEVFGLVDRFETTYANPQDPKSPRVLKAFVGRIHLDAHLDLDGTYSYETYGFESADECADTSRRVGQKLVERWHLGSSHFDAANPQRPSIALPPTSESWREVSSEMHAVAQSLSSEGRP
jgi:hypothetical protein